MILSVNPGFGGQKFITNTFNKVKKLKELKEKNNNNFLIEIDGGVNIDNVIEESLSYINQAKKTKTGQFSTSEQNLQRLKKNHPIIDHVLKYRSLEKLFSTYVEALHQILLSLIILVFCLF